MEKQKIKDLFEFLPKAKHKAGEGLEQGEYPFYTSSAIINKFFDNYDYEPDKLIFATGGSASVHYADLKFAVSTDNFILKPKENINAKYVYYYLKNNIQILQDGFHGAGLQHLSKDYLNEIKIPVLESNLQDKVVSILDKADEIRQKKKQANDKLDEFLKSTFNKMLNDNKKDIISYKLNDLLLIFRNGANIKQSKTSSGLPISRIETISDWTINLSKVGYADIFDEKYKDYYIKKGDILFSHINSIPHLGKCAICNFDNIKLIHGMNLLLLRNDTSKINSKFLYYLLKSEQFRSQLPNITKKSVNQASMSVTDLGKLNINILPIELQNKFAEFVEKVEQQKQKNEKVIEQMDNLFNALSQKAFRGEL